jgi:hypothetical protein
VAHGPEEAHEKTIPQLAGVENLSGKRPIPAASDQPPPSASPQAAGEGPIDDKEYERRRRLNGSEFEEGGLMLATGEVRLKHLKEKLDAARKLLDESTWWDSIDPVPHLAAGMSRKQARAIIVQQLQRQVEQTERQLENIRRELEISRRQIERSR